MSRSSPSERPTLLRKASLRDIIDAQTVQRDAEALRNAPWYILRPTSTFMSVWDGVTSTALIFTAVVTPFEVSFLEPAETMLDGLKRKESRPGRRIPAPPLSEEWTAPSRWRFLMVFDWARTEHINVLEAMTMLIERILADAGVQGEQFMETSGLKLRELLVWQLISGYTLREIEAKEELKKMITAPPAEENN